MEPDHDAELRQFHTALCALQTAFEEMTWNSMYLVGYCKTLEVCDSLHLLLPMEDGFDDLARLVRGMQVAHKRRLLAAANQARALILDVERILLRIGAHQHAAAAPPRHRLRPRTPTTRHGPLARLSKTSYCKKITKKPS